MLRSIRPGLAALAKCSAQVTGDLLGVGLPPPGSAVVHADFVPDAPGSWCMRCGSRVCVARAAGGRCTHGAHGRRIVRLGAHEGDLRDWIIAVKHNQWEAMGEHLGVMLAEQIVRCWPGVHDQRLVVVPVPMPWIRRADRGVDHARAIAAGVARVLHAPCVQPLRQRAHGSQVGRTLRAERVRADGRFAQRHGPLAWRARRCVAGACVVLVDDVRTTGATLALVGRALRALGARTVLEAVVSVSEPARPVTRVAARDACG